MYGKLIMMMGMMRMMMVMRMRQHSRSVLSVAGF